MKPENLLTPELFDRLIASAALAPSADNMQPWEFGCREDTLEVYRAAGRVLPMDVLEMFTWAGIGAAIENIVLEVASAGLKAGVRYNHGARAGEPAAVIRLEEGNTCNRLAPYIPLRCTNRSPFEPMPLKPATIADLSESLHEYNARVHWVSDPGSLDKMADMDARSSYIRLEHKPMHDELFSILRFTRKDIESTRYGLTFESLEVPRMATIFARLLRNWSLNRAVSRMGFGRIVAKQLSDKLRKSGAICLITASNGNAEGYMEAGRAMERIWLEATLQGLSVQPYGVLPQYLTRARVEPGSFLPQHVHILNEHRQVFNGLFPGL